MSLRPCAPFPLLRRCPGYEEEQPVICRNFTYPVPPTYTKGRPFDWASPAPAPTPAEAAPNSSSAGTMGLRSWLAAAAAGLALAAFALP